MIFSPRKLFNRWLLDLDAYPIEADSPFAKSYPKKTISSIKFMFWYFFQIPSRFRITILVTIFVGIISIFLSLGLTSVMAVTVQRIVGDATGILSEDATIIQLVYGIFDFLGIEIRNLFFFIFAGIFIVVQALFVIVQRLYVFYVNSSFTLRIKAIFYDKVIDSDWAFFINHDTAYLLNAFGNLSARFIGLYNSYASIANYFLSVVIYIASIAYIGGWQLTATIFAIILVSIPLFFFPAKFSRRFGRELNQRNLILSQNITLSYSNSKLIKSLGNEYEHSAQLRDSLSTLRETDIKVNYINTAIYFLRTISGALVFFGAITISLLVFELPTADIVASALILRNLYNRLSEATNFFQSINTNIDGAQEFVQIIEDAEAKEEDPQGERVSSIRKGIEFNDVSFVYPDGTKVLHGINLVVPQGKIVAIVGDTGSGKTTLIDLAVGLLTPTSGKILFDNLDSRKVNLRIWRRNIAYVSQGAPVFRETIANNLLLAAPTATMQEMEEACRLAQVDFIESLADGYHTVVGGPQNIGLSGGQRQRLALARALLRKPKMIILDEATNEMDVKTEAKVYSSILNKSEQTTIIFSAHRLTTTMQADIVYVVQNGRIVEQGSPSDLIGQEGGYFREYWQLALKRDRDVANIIAAQQ